MYITQILEVSFCIHEDNIYDCPLYVRYHSQPWGLSVNKTERLHSIVILDFTGYST